MALSSLSSLDTESRQPASAACCAREATTKEAVTRTGRSRSQERAGAASGMIVSPRDDISRGQAVGTSQRLQGLQSRPNPNRSFLHCNRGSRRRPRVGAGPGSPGRVAANPSSQKKQSTARVCDGNAGGGESRLVPVRLSHEDQFRLSACLDCMPCCRAPTHRGKPRLAYASRQLHRNALHALPPQACSPISVSRICHSKKPIFAARQSGG